MGGKAGQNNSDMDNFGATLSRIVHADVTQQAMQSPLEAGDDAFGMPAKKRLGVEEDLLGV